MSSLRMHNEHSHDDLEIEETCFLVRPPACIFDAHTLYEEVPDGFDTVKINLCARLNADLRWRKEYDAAAEFVRKGLRLFWEIDLGLFNEIKYPISNQSQFLSFCLSLEHFRDTLWKQFKDETLGVSLYRGEADFSQKYVWDEEQRGNLQEWLKSANASSIPDRHLMEQAACGLAERRLLALFCRDAAGEYLELLANCLPENLNRYLLLDATTTFNPLTAAQLLTQERFPLFNLAVRGGRSLGGEMGWEDAPRSLGYIGRTLKTSLEVQSVKVGICLPQLNVYCEIVELESCLKLLMEKGIAFRVVPEAYLTSGWDGLDYLIMVPKHLSAQGRRKLLGFSAAGGIVVPLEENFVLETVLESILP